MRVMKAGENDSPLSILHSVVDNNHCKKERVDQYNHAHITASRENDVAIDVPDRKRTIDSNGSKSKLSGLPMIHPRVTMNGMTKSAICYRAKKRWS